MLEFLEQELLPLLPWLCLSSQSVACNSTYHRHQPLPHKQPASRMRLSCLTLHPNQLPSSHLQALARGSWSALWYSWCSARHMDSRSCWVGDISTRRSKRLWTIMSRMYRTCSRHMIRLIHLKYRFYLLYGINSIR